MNTHTIVADIHQNVLKTREVIDGQYQVARLVPSVPPDKL